MAAVEYTNATEFGVYLDGVLVSYSTNASVEVSMDTREVTNKESGGNAEFREAKKSWTISGEFIFSPDATLGYDDLYDALQSREMVTIRFSPEKSGMSYFEGEGYITGLPMNAPVEDNVTFTMSLQGSGAFTRKTKS